MEFKEYTHIYFIGIGGIGMSALALYFHAAGKQVAGYDRTATEITNKLMTEGIAIHFKDAMESVPEAFLNKETTLVIYTPAIPKSHSQFQYFGTNDFAVYKRAYILGEITRNSFCFAVAGTHGKTTTTSIIAHLLYECKASFSAFLGGISENYNSNLLLEGTDISVVEADEFDRSFLNLSPDFACITSMDADHLDIYGDDESLKTSFTEFAACIKEGGKLFVKNGLPLEGISYGLDDKADYSAQNIRISQGAYLFDFRTPTGIYKDIQFNLPGRHNLSNALIALAMTAEYGFPQPQLAKALASYKGVKRRFTTHIKTDELVFVDDYAHHPAEIKAVYEALREMYPNDRIAAVFQPHLYSRTRDFMNDFASALSHFDELLLLDIYPARELPIEGITASRLLELIPNEQKQLVSKEALPKALMQSKARVHVTMGAGDIGEEVENIKNALGSEV